MSRTWSVEQRSALREFQLAGEDVDDATPQEELRRSWKRLASNWHPDRNAADEAAGTFVRLCFAWDLLKVGPRGVPQGDQGFRSLWR
jgi:hypothetical protein